MLYAEPRNLSAQGFDAMLTLDGGLNKIIKTALGKRDDWFDLPRFVYVHVPAGVKIGSEKPAWAGLTTGSGWSAGSRILLVNDGKVLGAGGKGANPDDNGQDGGTALRIHQGIHVVLENSGTIAGGGGGGGSQGGTWWDRKWGNIGHGCGGGGAGYQPGLGGYPIGTGTERDHDRNVNGRRVRYQEGDPGTETTGGGGGRRDLRGRGSGGGRRGGDLGMAGEPNRDGRNGAAGAWVEIRTGAELIVREDGQTLGTRKTDVAAFRSADLAPNE